MSTTPDLAGTFDWTAFDTALRTGDRRAELLASIRAAESWLDGSPEAEVAFGAATSTLATARAPYQALLLVRFRQLHALGVEFGPNGAAVLAAQLHACEAAADQSARCAAVRRAAIAADRTAALLTAYPDVVVTTPSPERAAAHAALLALGDRVQPAVEACGLGLATAERLDALAGVFDEFDALAARIPPDDPYRANLEHSRAHVALALAGAAAFLGRPDDAFAWYARAGTAFTAAGDPARAADARGRADTLRATATADLDADAARALAAVVGGDVDPFDRAAKLGALTRQQCATGDYFEAARTANEATGALGEVGVLDPEVVGYEHAAESLVTVAAAHASGSAFHARCTGIVTTWGAILQARAAAPERDVASRARAEAVLARMFGFGMAMAVRVAADEDALHAALAPYGVGSTPGAPDTATQQGWAWQRAVAAFDDEVQRASEACEALAPDAPADALAATAAALEQVAQQPIEGAAAMPPLQRARARRLTAAVRLQQGDADGCRTALDEAVAFVTTAHPTVPSPPIPASFADAGARQLYLDVQWTRLKAAGVADPAGALAVCADTVAFVEAFREGVSDPYQQSAFLASTTWAYDYGVGIARRLGAWDTMFHIMDAAKARGVLRRGAPLDAAALAEWRDIDADPDPTRRARRWSLANIARTRAATPAAPAPPPPSLAAVQGALGADEVVLDYYWQTADLLAVAAIDREGITVERIPLDAAAVEQLTGYTGLLATERTNRAFREFFTTFGALLLPETVRARMREKRRLIICAHRALHLFPFHAASWDGAPLIEMFAVRYVPNLTALLLPWQGPQGGPVLSVGCGTFVGPDAPPALTDAEPEAEEVAAAHRARGRAVTLLTGADASRAGLGALAATLPTYAVVHLATHARSVLAPDAADDPLATRVVLHDGALDGVSVAALGLRADLVVLAACNSGQRAIAGRGLAELPGDDVFGLQAVLFGSGVRCVLGALWPVASVPARSIMGRLHAELAGGAAPDVALQTALRAHRAGPERWRHPVYWAPYYLIELGRSSPTEDPPHA